MAGYSGRNSVLNKLPIGTLQLDKGNMKAIEEMFRQVPKQVKQDSIWAKFWRLNTKPLVKAAANNAPIAKKDVPYPPAYKDWRKSKPKKGKKYTGMMIKKGTLRDSIGFFRTRDSKNHLGGYVGPIVKGKFKKNKGGYFGAWVEFGSEVMHYGKFKSKNQPFMQRGWDIANKIVLANGLKDSETIFARVMKTYEKRMQKYGKLGY